MTRKGRMLRLAGGALAIAATLAWCSGSLRMMYGEPIDGHVVDARTGEPIAGAHVMYLWEAGVESTSFSGHNSPDICYHAAAAVTDEEGHFHIGAWKERARYRVPNREPKAWAYARGYVPAYLHSPGGTEHEPTVRKDDLIRMGPSNAEGEERLEEIWDVVRRGCSHGGASRRSLYPLLKAAYDEAKSIATTPQHAKTLQTFGRLAARAAISPDPQSDGGQTDQQIEQFITEHLK